MRDKSFSKKYINLTELIQQEYNRNSDLHGDKIKCKEGCSQCCFQIFRITLLDAEVIYSHINNLEIKQQDLLRSKAEKYISLKEHYSNESDEYFKKPEIPCPALDKNGSCMIYDARPVICRRFGPPVYDYKNPEKLFACELNFKQGDEIIDEQLIPNQTEIGMEWDELKTLYNTKYSHKKNASTTIAEAIFKAVNI
ncbi:MAG TPA: YkgJ family cysteine cluster protein [Ignavibacteria bacterium]|nr:YkgJ family cysteine cluster protein [Ignavibacteria bacterium]HMR39294.1 YkgJ family cysteine cluster protein [Ignavibacteria bacterium]